jgi:hypothetical protein
MLPRRRGFGNGAVGLSRWASTWAKVRLTAPREMPNSRAIDRIDAPC